MKIPVTITLDEGLLNEIEEKRGLASRSLFIESLLLRGFECDEVDVEEVARGYA